MCEVIWLVSQNHKEKQTNYPYKCQTQCFLFKVIMRDSMISAKIQITNIFLLASDVLGVRY